MLYTLLGYFEMDPIIEGENVMISLDLYEINSDYPKNKCSRSFANQIFQKIILLWICPWICQLYIHCITLVAHINSVQKGLGGGRKS